MDGTIMTPHQHAAPKSATNVKMISLALQGGGAHGAFTWGVLDRMLEDERIGIEAISAGAMNAVVKENFDRLNVESTIDIRDRYL
jgi:predicted patatin/cPLA2 family phospholipase